MSTPMDKIQAGITDFEDAWTQQTREGQESVNRTLKQGNAIRDGGLEEGMMAEGWEVTKHRLHDKITETEVMLGLKKKETTPTEKIQAGLQDFKDAWTLEQDQIVRRLKGEEPNESHPAQPLKDEFIPEDAHRKDIQPQENAMNDMPSEDRISINLGDKFKNFFG